MDVLVVDIFVDDKVLVEGVKFKDVVNFLFLVVGFYKVEVYEVKIKGIKDFIIEVIFVVDGGKLYIVVVVNKVENFEL